ncbi:quinolinate synthase NadA [Clostridium sporogenes]|uniref:Quinolinate synthase n=2 Tax=Clostridium TaxID=1485 RepID=A0A6M0T1S5_CLOBO|nr:quinolinate synthase NadA [Clostridium sporogenes]NFA60732.1 quinolinate synthase NadA [Clostridium botulinum]MDS1004815.1 quinolinate synthase NadA [Clostridium sporogenes]NFI72541.1 quinolinate synthase NadA [Clostridium sporogenes]NFL73447.1 quinolinate synthase NadA [Clostridium sporogenes]NFM23561.1 quinolinate synthase NadA [Clostridium sporogenes]
MKTNLKTKINHLKKEQNAIILAHYYQRPEVQDIADAVGDSYYLSKIAKNCSESTILFCGVKFMAESAKILSPNKTVLLPVIEAGCPMADMISKKDVLNLRKTHPDANVVCYINSSADVKSVSDVCCTSSNAINIIKNLPEKKIIFIPDKNLGEYIQSQIPDKELILWKGFCITHKKVELEEIKKIKNLYTNIKVLCHGECEKEIRNASDFIGSTGDIIKFATESNDKKFLIVTEEGVLHQLKIKNPEKNFYSPSERMECINMKKISLKNVYDSLLNLNYKIELDENLRLNAYNALINMHNLGGK